MPKRRPGSVCLLGADLTNSTTSLVDATGLSFSVVSGKTYRFKYYVVFQTAALTTGIQLSINAPTTTVLVFNVIIPITATTNVLGYRRAVNVATVGTGVDVINAQLLALVEGVIVPSANGTLILRYCSEVASSAVVIKAGSHGEIALI